MATDTRLFVGNLPENTNEKDLLVEFSMFGNITNLDLKTKSADENTKKNFAFITLDSSNYDVELCIKHFLHHNFKGNKLYVTRARESFLERLQRERAQAEIEKAKKETLDVIYQSRPKKHPVIKLSEDHNPRKRKVDHDSRDAHFKENLRIKGHLDKNKPPKPEIPPDDGIQIVNMQTKKQDADKKRIESLKRKRQEFKQKRMIIKTGLTAVDKVQNQKFIFSDEDGSPKPDYRLNQTKPIKQISKSTNTESIGNHRNNIFGDDGDSEHDELNFEIKKQFEGRKGQKVLDLQSRYKSDKRFTLDERFIEEETEDEESEDLNTEQNENVEIETADEKVKQLNILQDLLGVSIKSSSSDHHNNKKLKSKLGMPRFDPSQPEHFKYLAPVDEHQENTKSTKKKKKGKIEEVTQKAPEPEVPKVEVSKEQFYKVSESLKEAIAQPTSFSLRSLFNTDEDPKKDEMEQDTGFIPLQTSAEFKKKVKNPLDPGVRNPFVYDSSDSEGEEKDTQEKQESLPIHNELKVVWKENLFFTKNDNRFKEGLEFFNKTEKNEGQKERRELRYLMKKRIYNKERKNQMFQKKIGGRKKMMKKSNKKKS